MMRGNLGRNLSIHFVEGSAGEKPLIDVHDGAVHLCFGKGCVDHRFTPCCARGYVFATDAGNTGAPGKLRKSGRAISCRENLERCSNLREVSSAMFHGERIENRTTADRHLRRVSTHDKAITKHTNYRRFKTKLHETPFAGTYLTFGFEHAHARENFSRAEMNTHALA